MPDIDTSNLEASKLAKDVKPTPLDGALPVFAKGITIEPLLPAANGPIIKGSVVAAILCASPGTLYS